MKIATRIAWLQWQANPADPAALSRLIIAWITPGMREPRSDKTIDWTKNPYCEPDRNDDSPPRRGGGRRVFLTGILCGIVFTVAVWAASIWWMPGPKRSAMESAMYDNCLVTQRGNIVVCEAMMRVIERERTAEAATKRQATELLAAGFTKREVVKWAMEKGFVGSQLSDAVGISLQDLQEGKY